MLFRSVLAEPIVLATIFRAGVPFHQGFLRYFDNAENAFVSAYRKYKEKENFDICIEYLASPALDGKTLVLADPMLATGASMELSYRALLTNGKPAKLHIASVIASRKAVDYLNSVLPEDAELWIGVIDDAINARRERRENLALGRTLRWREKMRSDCGGVGGKSSRAFFGRAFKPP